MLDSECDELVPIFAGAGPESNRMVSFMVDPGNCDFEHQSGPARVGDNQVAAPAQYKKRHLAGTRVVHCVTDFRNGRGLDEIASWAADL